MKHLLYFVIIIVALAPAAARAQTAEDAAAFAYNQLGIMTNAHTQALGRTAVLEKQLHDLKAYAVACGDKPGCFVPTPADEVAAPPK